MNKMKVLPVLALTLGVTALPLAAQAQEQTDPNAKAKPLGAVKRAKDKATLRVRYNCADGEALWVSLKQVKSAKKAAALKKEGSSKAASAWYQSHRNKFTCDGESHTAKFTVDKVEPGSKGTLKTGKAWLQFCVTKGEGPEGELVLSHTSWVTVS